jgi:hypothetical protein
MRLGIKIIVFFPFVVVFSVAFGGCAYRVVQRY